MLKILTCLAFSIVITVAGNAQTPKTDTTAFRPYWEIGVDLLPLIDKENAPANTLFGRRNYFQENGKGKAWRFRAGVETEKRDFTDVAHWTPSTWRTYAPYLSFGHEWQHENKGFRWMVGVEGFGSYYRQNFFYLFSLADSLRVKGYEEEFKIGGAGVIGFQIKITGNFWLSSEARLSATYRRNHYKHDLIYKDFPDSNGKTDDLDKIFGLKFHPLYVINFIYSLKIKSS